MPSLEAAKITYNVLKIVAGGKRVIEDAFGQSHVPADIMQLLPQGRTGGPVFCSSVSGRWRDCGRSAAQRCRAPVVRRRSDISNGDVGGSDWKLAGVLDEP